MSRLARGERAKAIVTALLERIEHGRLDVVERGRGTTYGDPASELRATVTIGSPAAWRGLLHGSTGLADTYADGHWDCDDLVSLVRIAALNVGGFDRLRRRFAFLLRPAQALAGLRPRNTRAGGKRNIAAHYDLGNRLFELFLDPTLTYSCAWFPTPDASLEEAQIAKLDRICDALELGPEDHLLEIGTGWGGLSVHAASTRGCRVTTTTISREQAKLARERAAAAGLSRRVSVLEQDYRDLTGTFDKLASVEMIEAVGHQYFDAFFRTCSERLAPDGLMFLQAIVVDDRAYEVEKANPSFASRYIFPGGCLPSQEAIHRCLARSTDMRCLFAEDIAPHYALTLRHWRERFLANAERAGELGYDRRFRRMWELYLAWAEGGFREARIGDMQMTFAKPRYRSRLPGSASPYAPPRRPGLQNDQVDRPTA